MPRSKSSRRWLDRQLHDPYVQRAQREGYRSRAAYKLLEIQEKDRLLRPGVRVVDLGAAPGSWSQVAVRLVGEMGRVIALDSLPMEPLAGVHIIQGDFRETEVLDALRQALAGEQVEVVLSDMAPNISGTAAVDQPRAMYLAELAVALAEEALKPDGALAIKVFQGEGFDTLLKDLRTRFTSVTSRKPRSSRPQSRELYLVAKGFRGGAA